ncbi:MAG: hypothetical protein H7144_14260 [Burkholderiales bacterium]|nr:hypothetical protein [Phycisphaerae bacterium]
MGSHSHANRLDSDVTRLRPGNGGIGIFLMLAGLAGVIVAAIVSYTGAHDLVRFYRALLFGVAGYLAISCSALLFVLINHLVRAGWITNVRRVLETLAIQIPLLGILLIPTIITVAKQDGTIYSWAVPSDTPEVHHGAGDAHAATAGDQHGAPAAPHVDNHAAGAKPVHTETAKLQHVGKTDNIIPGYHAGEVSLPYPNEQVRPGVERDFDRLVAEKNHGWLKPAFWIFRIIAYLAILTWVAWYYRSRSIAQDATGDVDISSNLQKISGPLLMACGLIVTFIAFDMFMSLDPHWFSTMYGVYFFASGTQAMWAVMCLTFIILQSRGYLKESIGTEHFHDMGKMLWAFIVFFAYIAFSQYMLQWYANMPEETFWYDKRGYSTAHPNGYTPFALILLIGRFIIPFLGLVSRHVKRNRFGLGFWSVWLLACFFCDIYLLIMPEFHWAGTTHELRFGLPEFLCVAGVGALWLGNMIRMLAANALRPLRDPRVHESLAIQNI